MASCEDIREGIAKRICDLASEEGECQACREARGCPDSWSDVARRVDSVIAFLNDNGVVRKVEGQPPWLPDMGLSTYTQSEVVDKCNIVQRQMLEAGYTLTAPLIEPVSDAQPGDCVITNAQEGEAGVGFQYHPGKEN